ncbi:N-6 DNA methylase [Prosthecobacter sp.]|jgi:type I restriction enzyme M protein|uniref:type I restriction-modification system subunit M n=1 Tax=Prosthecobacter sp. TaxID=1965333 RepID=UPI00378355F6
MARKASSHPADSTATIGFEAKLWLTADKLRNNMDAAEYKHVVLGLIFLKYISDTFEEHRAKLLAGQGDYAGANPEDPDEYKAENVFWVPADARWSHLQANAKQPTIGKIVDDAMVAIERDNPRLKGVLPKDYARPGLDTARRDSALSPRAATPQSLSAAKDNQRLGALIDVIATISLTAASEGEKTHRSVDLLGRVYEYFLTRFASAEGKNGGQFYTPSCVVRCLVEMFAPYKGRIYDPACGSGGISRNSESRSEAETASRRLPVGRAQRGNFVESHGGKLGDISIYGQDKWARRQRPFGLAKRARRVRLRRQQPKQSNATTRRLAIMNLAIRGIEADIGKEHADTFRNVQHPDLRADYVLANPPFNDSDWFRKDDDVRWQPSGARQIAKGNPQGERGGVHQFGVPPKGNANFAWVQHFIHHLAPQGMAGFVLANGSMSSNQSGEGDIRRALIEADLVDTALRDSAFTQSEAIPQVVSEAKDNMVALPGQLFYSTQIPVCLWFLAKNKAADAKRGFRDRRKQTLFIDARKLGKLICADMRNPSLN